jgi:hypothetical protein
MEGNWLCFRARLLELLPGCLASCFPEYGFEVSGKLIKFESSCSSSLSVQRGSSVPELVPPVFIEPLFSLEPALS